MELTNDQIALLAGIGAVAASVMLMTLSYYLGQSARQRRNEQQQHVAPAPTRIAVQARRSKAA